VKRLDRSFIKWIIFHFGEYIHYYIGAIASLYFLHYFQSEIPGLTKELADLAGEDKLGEFNLYYLLILAISILVFRTLSRLLFFYPARVQQKYLRIELLGKLESAYPQNYKKYSEGEVFNLLYNDLNRLRGFVGFALLQVGNIIIAAIVFIPKLNEFNSDMLFAFIPVILSMIIFMISMYFIFPINKIIMEKNGEVQNFVIESYEAKQTIKNFSKENSIIESFRQLCKSELKYFFKSDAYITLPFNLIKVGFAASLIMAALFVYENDMKSSDLIFFSGFLFLVLEPLMALSWIGIVFSQGYASWSRLKTLLKDLKTPLDKNEISALKLWDNDIQVDLKDTSWTILIGETGVGKSYLLEKIATKLHYENKKYSFIQQEPFMYNDTLASNIFLGLDRTQKRIELANRYLKMFGLDVLEDSLEKVLELEIGENGKKISGGQAKRVALIRSLVSDADILIWDDPFSSVDLILEDQILNELKVDLKANNKTLLMSSHRLSTVRNSDYIYLLDKEQTVLEQGNVEELLNNNSKVDEYFRKQLV
jgi:ATP-binding cassette subfamily B protein